MMHQPRKFHKTEHKIKWEAADAENCDPANQEEFQVVLNKTGKKLAKASLQKVKGDDDQRCLESVVDLECVPKWVGDAVKKLPKDKLKEEYSLKSYLEGRFQQKEFWLTYASHHCLATKLSLASLALYVGRRREAKDICHQVRLALSPKPEGMDKSHFHAYDYLVDSLKLVKMGKKMKGKLYCLNLRRQEEVEECFKNAKKEWEESLQDPKKVAIYYFVKGVMSQVLGLDEQVALQNFKKARDLQPDFYYWHQLVYENIRRIRKLEGLELRPRRDEMEACQMAYQLCGEEKKVEITLEWAKWKKECLGGLSREEAGKEAVEIIQLFQEVIDNPTCPPNVKMNASILQAEMHLMKCLNLNAKEGRKRFLECYQNWPRNSWVLHKVGKFYHYGLNGGKFQNLKHAKHIYLQGMTASPRNFPCLMDYLKLLGGSEQTPKWNEMIDVIDKYNNFQKGNPERMIRLLGYRGLCYWLREGQDKVGDMEKAVENWVEALVEYPQNWSHLVKLITGTDKKELLGNVDINLDLKQVLRYIRRLCQKEGVPRFGAVDDFVSELESRVR